MDLYIFPLSKHATFCAHSNLLHLINSIEYGEECNYVSSLYNFLRLPSTYT
jgi:hypothetical protein